MPIQVFQYEQSGKGGDGLSDNLFSGRTRQQTLTRGMGVGSKASSPLRLHP